MPWSSVPVMPVEIMLLPKWFPFHLDKISYWARTVIVPLLVLQALKPKAINPRGVHDRRAVPPGPEDASAPPHKAPHQKWSWFLAVPRHRHRAARGRAAVFRSACASARSTGRSPSSTERLNGVDGLGAIYPAMANSVMMYDVLGYPADHPDRAIARASLDKLLVVKDDEAYCQPCVSPVWDTALVAPCAARGRRREGGRGSQPQGLDWLKPLQVLDVKGDWIARRPNVRPGGWAFQYANAHYPDLDDTAVVVMAMDRARALSAARQFDAAIERGARMGRRACRARTAAGARSMPTTTITTSTTSRSPITARCSIRRPRT